MSSHGTLPWFPADLTLFDPPLAVALRQLQSILVARPGEPPAGELESFSYWRSFSLFVACYCLRPDRHAPQIKFLCRAIDHFDA